MLVNISEIVNRGVAGGSEQRASQGHVISLITCSESHALHVGLAKMHALCTVGVESARNLG